MMLKREMIRLSNLRKIKRIVEEGAFCSIKVTGLSEELSISIRRDTTLKALEQEEALAEGRIENLLEEQEKEHE